MQNENTIFIQHSKKCNMKNYYLICVTNQKTPNTRFLTFDIKFLTFLFALRKLYCRLRNKPEFLYLIFAGIKN